MALGLLAAALPASAIKIEKLSMTNAAGVSRPVEVASERAVIRFSTPTADHTSVVKLAGATVIQELPKLGWTFVSLPPGQSVASGLQALRALPGVVDVEPDRVYRPTRLPDDPQVPLQWNLSKVNAFGAWDFTTGVGGQKVTIAMIDAGVEATHPDLAAKFANTQSQFCDPGANHLSNADDSLCVNETPVAACDHGTRTSGVAAAASDNAAGVAGMSWGAQLVSMRVFRTQDCNTDCSDASGSGCGTDDQAIANAIDSLVANYQGKPAYGQVVINMSLGGGGSCSSVAQGALDSAVNAGIPVAISAGNDGGPVNSPANCAGSDATLTQGVMPVGAVDQNDNIASFSSNGSQLADYGVVAPGVDVVTTDVGAAYTASATGTSFAAPHVAGLAALIVSARGSACGSAACAGQIQADIRGGADNIGVSALSAGGGTGVSGNFAGAGRIDAFRSLRLAARGTLSDFAGDQKAIAFPNPFRVSQNGTATITVPTSLQSSGTSIKIFTPTGQLVRQLSGTSWDGRNDAGQLVASGTYVFFVKTDKGNTSGRLAVIR